MTRFNGTRLIAWLVSVFPKKGVEMARQNYGYEKRQKELAKAKKKEEKRQRKLEKGATAASGEIEETSSDSETEPVSESDEE